MVFNIEPGLYIDGFGGMRHCDMVVVTPGGAEVLTPPTSAPASSKTAAATKPAVDDTKELWARTRAGVAPLKRKR